MSLNGGAFVTMANGSIADGSFSLADQAVGVYTITSASGTAFPGLNPFPNFSTQVLVSTPVGSVGTVGDTITVQFTEQYDPSGPTPPYPVIGGLTANILTNFSVNSGYWFGTNDFELDL